MTDTTNLSPTLEWLDANGRSSFAMGTASLCLTRRYHGLLCTTKNEGERQVLVASIEEHVTVGDRTFASSTTAFERHTSVGHDGLRSFTSDPWPTWTYDVGPVRMKRSLFVAHNEPTTVVTYEHLEGPACMLQVRPLLAMRGAHELRRHRSADEIDVKAWTGKVTVTTKDASAPALTIVHDGEFEANADVWRDFYLSWEADRGLPAVQDLLTPGVLRIDVPVGGKVSIVFTTKGEGFFDLDALIKHEGDHRAAHARSASATSAALIRAARSYRIGRRSDSSIATGFPWYGARTREALFALPGLFLSAGDVTSAKELLYTCAEKMRGGLLPSFLDGSANPVYEVDSALYFVECVRMYVEQAGLGPRVEDRLYEKVLEVVASCAAGTLNVTVDDDGLLSVDDEAPTTWMNSIVDGMPVTQRSGKAVEVQALWYNALMVTADLAQTRKATVMASELRGLARRVKEQFTTLFWNDERGICADVVASQGSTVVRDMSMRPNQLFAASLCYPLLTHEQAARMLEHVHEELVTLRGLRTLAEGEPGYVGRVPSGESDRHRAMHQGAAWPWLVGPYCRALVYAHGRKAVLAEVERVLAPLINDATHEGLSGHLAECYDAEEPQQPHGAPAYALSLAEVLRTHAEILEHKAPKDRISSPPTHLAPLAMTWIETGSDPIEPVESVPAPAAQKKPAPPRRKKT
ncbi:MAG: glycogen debranching enzyme family protein [Sandaracinaceae bacterium]|nr:glycogen debranching enzyme family protein [Sandaracinaceae bacterium]